MGKMMFVVNLVNNKVVDNLLILLVSNFHGNRLNGLRVIAVGIGLQKCLFSGISGQVWDIDLFVLYRH